MARAIKRFRLRGADSVSLRTIADNIQGIKAAALREGKRGDISDFDVQVNIKP